jgi:hypothetical protein
VGGLGGGESVTLSGGLSTGLGAQGVTLGHALHSEAQSNGIFALSHAQLLGQKEARVAAFQAFVGVYVGVAESPLIWLVRKSLPS